MKCSLKNFLFDFRHVLRDLTPVSRFKIKVECGCPSPYRRTVKFLAFEKVLTRVANRTSTSYVGKPAMRKFDDNTLQFDDDYWEPDTDKGESWSDDDEERNLVRKIDNFICPTCLQGMKVLDTIIPPSTWVLVAEITKDHQQNRVSFREFPRLIYFNGCRFKKAWASYLITGGHFVSVHRMGPNWYYYDDLERDPKLIKMRSGLELGEKYVLQRLFYYRDTRNFHPEPGESPHRCLQFANAADEANEVRIVAEGYPGDRRHFLGQGDLP